MADEEKRRLEIPWATLLPIVAALAGIIAQYKPLVSARPAVPSTKSSEQLAAQDIDARLWQDPLGVVEKAKTALDEVQTKDSVDRTPQHSISSLAAHIKDAAAKVENRVLLLPVMLDSGPYLEQAESRLRARQAVLEALSESDFIPVDGEHLGFVFENDWPWVGKVSPDNGPGGASLLFAWEQCSRANSFQQAVNGAGAENNFERVFVLWLPAARFNPYPLGNIASLIKQLAPGLETRVIGPANSTGLQAMIREIKAWKEEKVHKFAYGNALDKVSIFSARATASDDWLAGYPLPEGRSLEDEIEEGVSENGWGNLQFYRTILTDDEVLRALVEELSLRDVHVQPWRSGKKWRGADHIVILSEWDSAYGRALAQTFLDEAKEFRLPETPKNLEPHIDAYRYMHGIDGRLPGDSSKEEPHDDSAKNQNTSSTAPVEATEGLNQSDFLRRLAQRLKEQERDWEQEEQGGVRAIGVLGSDIYDKLMILRALRPAFPSAIFFTNNYDAHFERRDDWDDVHNLVIASPFGGTLSPQRQAALAPFRDNNQTSMYAGTLRALGKITNMNEIVRQPHIFEIGRKGAHELIKPPDLASTLVPNSIPADGFSAWLARPGVLSRLALAGVALFLMAGWIILSMVDRRRAGGGGLLDKLKRGCASTPFWLIFGLPLVVFSVAALAVSSNGALEPLTFLSGISIWPSEMLRLMALLLAIHFLIKARIDLDANEEELSRRFHLAELPIEKWHWRKMRIGLRRWHKEHPGWMKPEAHFTAKEAWAAYLRRNQFWPRLIRITVLFGIYAIFSYGVFALFPAPITPARGKTAFSADLWILVPAVIGLMLLTFYVVDAIRLNSNFIRIITGGVKEWEPEISESRGRIPPLEKEDLARYYDIAFVAQRTEVVAPLIWYPLIILAVMILARSTYFDNWTWPFSLVLIFTLNALWAFGAAALLRRAAEDLRAAALNSLEVLRIKSYKDPERQAMFAELIAEIRGLKRGAFAPLSEQPFVRAVILPSGGLGLIAVAQRLFENF